MMDYEDLNDRSVWTVEQTMYRVCGRTGRRYAVTWRHMPSYYLDKHFKVYVN